MIALTRKKFDCPECGTTYVDYENLTGLKHGGKICEECDSHIDLENVVNVRDVEIRGTDPAFRIYTEDSQSWVQEFSEDPHPDNANSIERVEPLFSPDSIEEIIDRFCTEWINERVDRPEELKEYEMSPEKAHVAHRFAEDLIEKFQEKQTQGDS